MSTALVVLGISTAILQALLLLIYAGISLLRRPQIQDAHEFGDASNLAPAKPDWQDRVRKAGL